MQSRMNSSLGSFLSVLPLIVSLITLPRFTHQQQYDYGNPYPPSPPAQSYYNPRLERAYVALQTWKQTFTCDPRGVTANWYGPYVCQYRGVFCAPAPDDPNVTTVAGIDLNHAGICGYLHEELGLLTDLAILHLNSNYFFGTIPASFKNMNLLYELDLSSNRLGGPFPFTVLQLPALKFLDLRYNYFVGDVPGDLFDRTMLDAVFLNHNNFQFSLPENFGNYNGSALVLANTRLQGCIPSSIGRMASTLNEILLSNTGLSSCIPSEIGKLSKLTVFDVSENRLVGQLPEAIGDMESLEQLNIASNLLAGDIPESVCELSSLKNFTYSYNFFTGEPRSCITIPRSDDSNNCMDGQGQRPENVCKAFLSKPPVHCEGFRCPDGPPKYPPPSYHYR